MSDDKRVTLLPCPFCGGPATFEECAQGSSTDAKSCTWSVGCANEAVDCIGYQMLATFSRKCEAAEAWNKRAALAAADGADGWRDIATAPKDGTLIDIWASGARYTDCRWGRCDEESNAPWGKPHWRGIPFYRRLGIEQQAKPTHWMLTPSPPRSPSEQGDKE